MTKIAKTSTAKDLGWYWKHTLGTLAIGLASQFGGQAAVAGEGSFGWIYTLDLQPKGTWEIEQRANLVRGQASGKYDFWQHRTELAYGVSNDFQLAGYINRYSFDAGQNTDAEGGGAETGGLGVPGSAAGARSYSKTLHGYSIEGIWRLSNPVIEPVGVGVYLEFTDGQLKRDLESRLILQSNFLDDKLVLAANLIAGSKVMKFDQDDIASESEFDVRLGASYRFANRWTAGLEYRHHNDFTGYKYRERTQVAQFFGPNVHYATKNWWVTAAWLKQLGGTCFGPGEFECSRGYAWDGHGVNEYTLKLGVPF